MSYLGLGEQMPKFTICLVAFILSFSQAQASDLLNEQEDRAHESYLELTNKFKLTKKPLISLMADKPRPLLKELIKKENIQF